MNETGQLLANLSSPDSRLRHQAAVRLGFLTPEPAVIDALKNTARLDPELFIRRFAVLALDRLGCAREAGEIRIEMLDSPDDQTVRDAICGLGTSTHPGAGPALLQLLSRNPPRLALGFVFNALATLRHPAALDAVSPFLSHPEPYLRAVAAQALGKLGDPRAVPLLQNLAGDSAQAWTEDRGPSLSVGDIAAAALSALGYKAPAPPARWKLW